MLPCQQPLQKLWLHLGTPVDFWEERIFCCFLVWQNDRNSAPHFYCMPLRLTGLSFRFLSPHSFQIHLLPTCFHLEMMFLPAVSCACPDHQTPVTHTKEVSGVCKHQARCQKLQRKQQVAECLHGVHTPLSAQCKVFIKYMEYLEITNIQV